MCFSISSQPRWVLCMCDKVSHFPLHVHFVGTLMLPKPLLVVASSSTHTKPRFDSTSLNKFQLHTFRFCFLLKRSSEERKMNQKKLQAPVYLLPSIVRTNWAYRYSIYLISWGGEGERWRKCRLNVKAINLNWVRGGLLEEADGKFIGEKRDKKRFCFCSV